LNFFWLNQFKNLLGKNAQITFGRGCQLLIKYKLIYISLYPFALAAKKETEHGRTA
jgi:hypothetical protein